MTNGAIRSFLVLPIVNWLAPLLAFIGVIVGARLSRRNDHAKNLREMRFAAYHDFLRRSNDLMVLRGQIASGQSLERDKFQEQLSAHRTSGTNAQLLTSDPQLYALVEEMVIGAGVDIRAAQANASVDRVIRNEHFTELMIKMRRELGVSQRRGKSILKFTRTRSTRQPSVADQVQSSGLGGF